MRPSSPGPRMKRSSSASNTPANEHIRVAARVRPKTPRESSAPTSVHVLDSNGGEWPNEMIVASSTPLVHNGKQKFRFDAVFPEHASQEAVFEEMAAPLVKAVCSGINASLFAYGQTGTGKTHTMLGEDIWMLASSSSKELSSKQRSTLETSEMRGVIPRSMSLLFNLLKDKQHKVSVSYFEIYNEKILDLLNPTNTEGLEIREDKQGNSQVVDGTIIRVSTVDEVFDALWKGAKNRAVSSTDMNEHSSRSHTIFQILVETRGNKLQPGTKAKLNLIDLAGSEKWRPHQLSGFSDQRIMEMTSINQSLSNLGNCVRGLLSGQNHIPFRNSKLTRLIQDSLGGNARTGFVVTVSPSELAFEETISTLLFADRAKRVAVRAEANLIETPEGILRKLEIELQKTREENQELRERLENSVPNTQNTETPLEGAGVGSVLKKCLNVSSEELLSKPEKFLHDYHEHLRLRKADNLSAQERLALVEWSVSLQSEELGRELGSFKKFMEESKNELETKQAQIDLLTRQLNESKQNESNSKKQVHEIEAEYRVTKEQLEEEIRRLKETSSIRKTPSKEYTITSNNPTVPSSYSKKETTFSSRPSSSIKENKHISIQFNSSRASPMRLNNNNTGIRQTGPPPQVWDRFVDETSGRAYYHCKETGQTTWKRPISTGGTGTIIIRGE